MNLELDSSTFLNEFVWNENKLLDKETLLLFSPYLHCDLISSDYESKVQWYYNLFTVARYIDLGLAHSLHHNQVARNYVSLCCDDEVCNRLLQPTTIGSTAQHKKSNTCVLSKHNNEWILNGTAHWLTNIHAADFITLEVLTDDNKDRYRILIDAKEHQFDVSFDFSESLGMLSAKPGSATFNHLKIDNKYILSKHGWPDPGFEVSALTNLCFITNLTATTLALFNEIKQYASMHNRCDDIAFKRCEVDVMVTVDNWVHRVSDLNFVNSEFYWYRYIEVYMFAKKTILDVIALSRDLGIQYQLLNNDSSRVFRNALVFSSHMAKLENFHNLWGNHTNNDFNIDTYVKHYMNKFIRQKQLPTDIN